MCSRGVWQMRAMVLQYCKHSGASAGVRCVFFATTSPGSLSQADAATHGFLIIFFSRRQYIKEGHLNIFARANPQIEIAVFEKPNQHPCIRGYFVSDKDKVLSLRGLSHHQIVERIQFLRDMRPMGMRKLAKAFRTTPSIQGPWEIGQLLDKPHRTIRA